MKLYIAALVLSFSTISFATESVQLGEVASKFDQRDCSAPEVSGCEPCYKACTQHNKDAREHNKLQLSSGSQQKKPAQSSTRKE